jgi:aromatic-L-amino-acid decarboxylase
MLGLPDSFFGVIGDTASSNTLYALAAAREMHPELGIRERGMAGRTDLPAIRVYCSEEAHSSVDKAVMTLGFGLASLQKIPADSGLRMDAAALAARVAADRREGLIPLAVVATVGTTSTTAIDPVPTIADVCEREKMWLHVDASYGGIAAIVPEMRDVLDGCDRAQSLVVNPHKWLFTPMDCSALYTSRPDLLKRAFQHVPDYLAVSESDSVPNLMDYGVSLGRRFRALKLWFVIRSFGVEGLRSLIKEHIRIARAFSRWIDADPELERMADADFSTAAAEMDKHNERLLELVTRGREVYLSHTRVRGKYALRLAIGNIHTNEAQVRRAFDLVKKAAGALK